MIPKLIAVAAISFTAYMTWASVNKPAIYEQLSTKSMRRLQSGRWDQQHARKKGTKQNKASPKRGHYDVGSGSSGGTSNPEARTSYQKNNKNKNKNKNKNNKSKNNDSNNNGNNYLSSYQLQVLAAKQDHWKKRGDQSGLKVTVLSNLSGSNWNAALRAAVNQWNNGAAVALTISSMTYESSCKAVVWNIKVCNSNYGNTNWKGVNQLYVNSGDVVASIAKFNDYFVRDMDYVEKQYTMCHELGHGLGLKHSDEDFNNKDTGNCMDYTNKHSNNMYPGARNFNLLKAMYGTVGGRRLRGESPMSDEEERLFEEAVEKHSAYSLDAAVVPSESGAVQSPHGRLLRKTDWAEFYEKNLGNGYSVRTTLLLA